MLLNRHPRIRRAKPLLGTIVEIAVFSLKRNDRELTPLVTQAFNRVKDTHSMMSFFDTDSEVSRINNSAPGEAVQISNNTRLVLSRADDLYRESRGSFDMMHRGREDYPDAELVFLPSGDVIRSHAAPIDLGGIAKGFAVDQAAAVFLDEPDVSAVINAGGDIRFIGPDYFPVSIRSPRFDGTFFDGGFLANCAIATSVFSSTSISVIAPTCVAADMLTKAIRKIAEPKRTQLLTKYRARYIQIDDASPLTQSDAAS